MSILYAPIIADTVPGFTTWKIEIPFEDNPAVQQNQYTKYDIQITDTADPNNYAIITYAGRGGESGGIYAGKANDTEKLVDYSWFTYGKYYKIQIRYRAGQEVGPFSTVAIGRCCAPGIASISLESLFTVKGVYSVNVNDKTEIPYYYQFIFYTDENCTKVFKKTDKFLSVNNKALENTYLLQEIPVSFFETATNGENFVLYVKYKIFTINGLVVESETPLNMQRFFGSKNQSGTTLPVSVGIDKFIINLKGMSIEDKSKFILARKEDSIYNILLSRDQDGLKKYEDHAIEQGKHYSYRVFYKVDKDISAFWDSQIIVSHFEDMVLSDSEKTLRIKYNPQISSFKHTILEQKVDTLGGSYPIFFRNGNVKYAEIPISGLISYLTDEKEEFVTAASLGLNDSADRYKTTSLVPYNFTAERRFKLAVLEWLNNGKPKLFRSPAEGNYIVRLMNVSLSPMNQLGRMLHSFSATGYEIAEYTAEELNKANLQFREVN